MYIEKTPEGHVLLYASRQDTANWAFCPGRLWPRSKLAGRALTAEFAPNGDLLDYHIRPKVIELDIPCDEFDAFADYCFTKYRGAPLFDLP